MTSRFAAASTAAWIVAKQPPGPPGLTHCVAATVSGARATTLPTHRRSAADRRTMLDRPMLPRAVTMISLRPRLPTCCRLVEDLFRRHRSPFHGGWQRGRQDRFHPPECPQQCTVLNVFGGEAPPDARGGAGPRFARLPQEHMMNATPRATPARAEPKADSRFRDDPRERASGERPRTDGHGARTTMPTARAEPRVTRPGATSFLSSLSIPSMKLDACSGRDRHTSRGGTSERNDRRRFISQLARRTNRKRLLRRP